MRTLLCALAQLTDQVAPPSPFLTNPGLLSQIFAAGSLNEVRLHVSNALLQSVIYSGATYHQAFHLHAAIRKLTGNPINATSVDKVAILFGNFYEPFPSAFGVMFDRGFVNPAPDDPNTDPNLIGPPREGCAVFLGAIKAARRDPLQYARQILFSTVHEFGHVFNLQHIEEPKNFLSTSSADATYEPSAFHFHHDHVEVLKQAPRWVEIWPGGSAFGDTGPIGHFDLPWNILRPSSSSLELSLEMSRRSFFYFEPVELDIVLNNSAGTKRTIRVPNSIDPGYETFRIWIEEPSGERRLYRPPRLYCPHDEVIYVGPKKPFRRDISIFGESGGFTFRRAGIHKLWAEFALPTRRLLRSNTIEIEVRSIKTPTTKFDQANKLFESVRGRTLCYHRIDRSNGRAIEQFEDYLRSNPKSEANGVLRYSLARAYLNRSHKSRKNVVRARSLFKASLQHQYLGTHQRHVAQRILDSES